MKKVESIDYWHELMFSRSQYDTSVAERMYSSLKTEYPGVCTMMLEQTCNLDCEHCFFKPEKTSKNISEQNDLQNVLKSITLQLEPGTSIVDGGRILRNWHISLLEDLRKLRKDLSIGMVDNGTYLKLEKEILQSTFRFDWIDISIDGTKETHNRQRRNPNAFDTAIKGLREARRFIAPKNKGGKVTSLFSSSKLNYYDLSAAANFLFERNLVDEFHITPVSQVFRNKEIVMELAEFKAYWEELKKTFQLGKEKNVSVFTRIYQLNDMKLLAQVVGKNKILKALQNLNSVSVGRGCIEFLIDGVPVIYVPLSICPSETFLIGADGYYRAAYAIQFTLDELHKGKSIYNEDTKPFTVSKITPDSSYRDLYQQGVRHWKAAFGLDYLQNEFNFFSSLRN